MKYLFIKTGQIILKVVMILNYFDTLFLDLWYIIFFYCRNEKWDSHICYHWLYSKRCTVVTADSFTTWSCCLVRINIQNVIVKTWAHSFNKFILVVLLWIIGNAVFVTITIMFLMYQQLIMFLSYYVIHFYYWSEYGNIVKCGNVACWMTEHTHMNNLYTKWR